MVDSALEDLESGGVEKRRQRLRAKLKPAVRPAQASKARGSVGLEGNGHVRSVKPRGFHEWSEVDVDAELERLDTESLVEQGLTQQEITNKKILEIVQDETLEEDELVVECVGPRRVRVRARVCAARAEWDARDWIERSVGMREILNASLVGDGEAWAVDTAPEPPETTAGCARDVAERAREFAASGFVRPRAVEETDLGF